MAIGFAELVSLRGTNRKSCAQATGVRLCNISQLVPEHLQRGVIRTVKICRDSLQLFRTWFD